MNEEWGLLISKYIDGEVTPSEKLLVQGHLKQCKDCQRLYETFVSNEGLVRDTLIDESLGDQVADDVIKSIKTSRQVIKPHTFPRFAKYAIAAALLLLVAGGVIAAVSMMIDSAKDDMRQQYAREIEMQRNALTALVDWVKADEREQKKVSVKTALENSKGDTIYASFLGTSVYVCAKFEETGKMNRFDLFRRVEGNQEFDGPINRVNLASPNFEDKDVIPGRKYYYMFKGYDDAGKVIPSQVVSVKVPAPTEITPDMTGIFFLSINGENAATFVVKKNFNGRWMSREFKVFVGDEIGDTYYDFLSNKTYDFRTGFKLAKLEESDQIWHVADGVATQRVNYVATLQKASITRFVWRIEEISVK